MAAGNIDSVYKLIIRAKEQVAKAQAAVLDVADIMDEIIVAATAVGGKVQEMVPQHINAGIDKLTKIADQDLGAVLDGDQSSLTKLAELIESIPYRDIKPTSPSENREARKQMPNITGPDLSAGPQSQLAKQNESTELSDYYYARKTAFDQQGRGTFSFDQIRESKIFGEEYDEDMMSFAQKAPASLGKYIKTGTQKIRETINRADMEMEDDEEPSGKLTENFALNFRSPGIDDAPFGAIFNSNLTSTPGHIVGDGVL